ncbi:MAG TPA: galactokinase [Dermatophilaceae bacterium]|nr:galactokinase [Dermatophilaceae bacterium]
MPPRLPAGAAGADGPERAAELFADRFGGAPDGLWAAPGRVNLIGEHTDYNGGLALPIALRQRTYAAARVRADGQLRVVSDGLPGGPVEVALDEIGPGRPGGWAAYPAGVLWALREAGHAVPGLDVAVSSDVPVGAGLSSSAALECAVGSAVSDLAGLGLLADSAGRAALADACRIAENVLAGAPTGGMDQAAAMLCRPGHALRLDCRDGSTTHVPVDLAGAGLELLVVDTRAPHALVDGQYAARRQSCEQAARALGVDTLREVVPEDLAPALQRLPDQLSRRRVRHVVGEIARVDALVAAATRGDWPEAGRLMLASHASLRDDYEVSCPQLDVAVDVTAELGALGARMTGGGFGGCAIALLPAGRADAAVAAVTGAFLGRGWAAPAAFVAVPSGGAERLR